MNELLLSALHLIDFGHNLYISFCIKCKHVLLQPCESHPSQVSSTFLWHSAISLDRVHVRSLSKHHGGAGQSASLEEDLLAGTGVVLGVPTTKSIHECYLNR